MLDRGREDLYTSQRMMTTLDSQPLSLSSAIQITPTPRVEMNSTKWKELFIGVGKSFRNADECRQSVFKYSLAHHFSHKYVKNCNEKIIVRCQAKGCEWVMRAYEMCPGSKILIVRSFHDVHKHDAQEDLNINHSTRSKLTSSIIVDSLRDNIDKTPTEIRRDLYREYGVRLNYSQAYWGKRRALLNLEGSPKDSYKLIPWLCDRLKETDQDTVAKWVSTAEDRFEHLFNAYGCSIKGFLAGCRHILVLDILFTNILLSVQ